MSQLIRWVMLRLGIGGATSHGPSGFVFQGEFSSSDITLTSLVVVARASRTRFCLSLPFPKRIA